MLCHLLPQDVHCEPGGCFPFPFPLVLPLPLFFSIILFLGVVAVRWWCVVALLCVFVFVVPVVYAVFRPSSVVSRVVVTFKNVDVS